MCPHLSSALTKFKCLASKHSCLNTLWTYFLVTCPWLDPTTVTQLAGVSECRRKRQLSFLTIGCWLFIYRCSEDLNKQFSPSRNRFLRRTPTSQDRFALRQLLWPDYSTYKSFDSSTIVIPSCTSYRLLCVIGSEMNYPPSLKLNDATLTDQ